MEMTQESPVHKENAAPNPPPVTKPIISSKNATPDRLKVPKAFKYPERYTSPTDQMMSPVSKRLFGNGKNRKAAAAAATATAAAVPLPHSGNPPKPLKIQPQALSSSSSSSSLQPALIQS